MFVFFFLRLTDKSNDLGNLRVIKDSNEVFSVNKEVQIEGSACANIIICQLPHMDTSMIGRPRPIGKTDSKCRN